MREGIKSKDGAAMPQAYKLMVKNTRPPEDQGCWMAMTMHLYDSASWRSLSFNARKAIDRIIVEHLAHGRCHNGRLIVTHTQFIEYGVTAEYVGDALDELAFKGLLRIARGRAGDGTAHPNIYRLTFTGGADGTVATNEWRRFTEDDAKSWVDSVREEKRIFRKRVGRKSKGSLRVSEIRPLRVSEIREVA